MIRVVIVGLSLYLSLFFQSLYAQELPQESLYHMDIAWTNQDGKVTPLKTFHKKVVIMAMTYTSCQYSCPLTIKKLEAIEKNLKQKKFTNYQFIIASLDPIKDKPQVLKDYMSKSSLSPEHWTFLTAKDDREVRKLAVLLDIQYQKIEGGDFSHSNAVTVLDLEGKVAYRLPAISSDHKELVDKVVAVK